MHNIILNIDRQVRFTIFPEGGLEVEVFVDNLGWVLQSRNSTSDVIVYSYLKEASSLIMRAARKLGP